MTMPDPKNYGNPMGKFRHGDMVPPVVSEAMYRILLFDMLDLNEEQQKTNHGITYTTAALESLITAQNRNLPVVRLLGKHYCETCGKPATHCYREGRGTGHSEHVCACPDHTEE